MFRLEYKNQFKKDLKLLKKRSVKDFNILLQFLRELQDSVVTEYQRRTNLTDFPGISKAFVKLM